MRLLLDENVSWRLRRYLSVVHEVWTVAYRGWDGIRNGRLIDLAEQEFDVLITLNKSIPPQQNISRRNIAVIVLLVKNSELDELLPLVPKILDALDQIHYGKVMCIKA